MEQRTARMATTLVTLLVSVTAEDIALGVPGDNDRCALTRAAKRAMRDAGWRPAERTVRLERLPKIVREFVRLHDDPRVPRALLAPFAFDLTLWVEPRVPNVTHWQVGALNVSPCRLPFNYGDDWTRDPGHVTCEQCLQRIEPPLPSVIEAPCFGSLLLEVE